MLSYEKEAIQSKQTTKSQMSGVPEVDIQTTKSADEKQDNGVFPQVFKQTKGLEPSLEKGNYTEKSKEDDWREKSSLERGGNLQKTERELQGSDISKMPEGVSADGEERRLHNATQISDGSISEQTTDKNRSSASHRPQSSEQQDRKPCAFCKQYFTQAVGAFGYGSALKPACEPISVCRKPISEKNLADNYLKWGVGGINIDGCRVGTEEKLGRPISSRVEASSVNSYEWSKRPNPLAGQFVDNSAGLGRFPANLIHDGSDEVVGLFPQTKSGKMGKQHTRHTDGSPNGIYGKFDINHELGETYGDSGSASRFFYCAKASKSERNRGCEELEREKFVAGNYSQSPVCKTCDKTLNGTNDHSQCSGEVYYREMESKKTHNNHPTVKPIALMEYLVKLVSKENSVVLDPFAGSGSTLIACKNLNRQYIGIEREEEYIKIINARLK